ncbi:MAG: tetratricopeptide repeat protein [Gallionellaceae bacterium]
MNDTDSTWLTDIPEIIRVSATSPFGVVALAILVVAFLGLILKPEGDSYRVAFGITIVVSVLVFATVAIFQSKPKQPENPDKGLTHQDPNSINTYSLINQAGALIEQDRWAEARKSLDKAKFLLPATGNALLEGQIAVELGILERKSGNPILARQQLGIALSVLPDTAHVERAKVHLQLGITLHQQDDRSGSRRELEVALRDFRSIVDRNGEVEAALELAELLKTEGNYANALARLNEAETAFDTAGNQLGLANVNRSRGAIERFRDRVQSAIPYLEKALNTYRVNSSRSGEVLALWELGEASVQLGQFDDARKYHQESLQIAESIRFPLGIRNAYIALANIEAKRNRPKNAAEGFSRAIDHFRSVSDKLGEVQARLGLASAQIQLGDTASARSELTRANDGAISLRDALIQSQIRWYQASLDMQVGQMDKASVGFRQAFDLAVEANDIGLQGKALLGLGDTLAKNGQLEEADKTLERARLLLHQASLREDAAIAGLSLASLRLSRGQIAACSLLDDVIKELEAINRLDILQLARQLRIKAACT